jgi:hypothetical protein
MRHPYHVTVLRSLEYAERRERLWRKGGTGRADAAGTLWAHVTGRGLIRLPYPANPHDPRPNSASSEIPGHNQTLFIKQAKARAHALGY